MQKIKVYQSGLQVVVEEMQGFTSVAFAINVGIGALNEDQTNEGISHVIEHMLFKGTQERNASQIADQLERIGAQYNAYTSKEETAFYVKSVALYTPKCVEILADMLQNSKIDEKELKREKNVVLEEMKMYKDDPSSVCADLVDTNFYKGCAYSTNIIGTRKSVKAITRDMIIDYMSKQYLPQNIVLSFAGNITFEDALSLVEKNFPKWLEGEAIPKTRHFERCVFPEKPIQKFSFKDNSQSEVCIQHHSVSRYSDMKYASALLNIIWGSSGNMSSRLFQSIREKKGLVYRIGSSINYNDYGGDISISFSTSTKNVDIAIKTIDDEIKKLVKKGITEAELELAKITIYSSTMLRSENTNSICLQNARELAIFGKIMSRDEYLEKINNVTIKDVNNYINYVYKEHENNKIICIVGRK